MIMERMQHGLGSESTSKTQVDLDSVANTYPGDLVRRVGDFSTTCDPFDNGDSPNLHTSEHQIGSFDDCNSEQPATQLNASTQCGPVPLRFEEHPEGLSGLKPHDLERVSAAIDCTNLWLLLFLKLSSWGYWSLLKILVHHFSGKLGIGNGLQSFSYTQRTKPARTGARGLSGQFLQPITLILCLLTK